MNGEKSDNTANNSTSERVITNNHNDCDNWQGNILLQQYNNAKRTKYLYLL